MKTGAARLIAAAVSSALALPMAAQAVEFSVSGHINRAIVSVDGGTNNGDLVHKDVNSSESRFRFTGSQELESGMTAGVQLEYGLTGNVRHANVYLSSAGGKLTFGQASAAADGMHGTRLSDTAWLGGVTNWCSYHSANAAPATGTACHSNNGGRKEILRYDTPAIGPASVAISSGNNDYSDAKLFVSGSMGDAGYDVRIGYIGELNDGGASDVTTVSGSVSIGSGMAVAVAWSQDDMNDGEYQYIEFDHSYGDGSVGAYRRGERGVEEGSLWGVGVGHSLGGGATAYAGHRMLQESYEKSALEKLSIAPTVI